MNIFDEVEKQMETEFQPTAELRYLRKRDGNIVLQQKWMKVPNATDFVFDVIRSGMDITVPVQWRDILIEDEVDADTH